MITDAFFSFICSIPLSLLNNLPNFSLSIPNGVLDWVNNIFGFLGYIFPIAGLIPIFVISISIKAFQIVWSILNKIKSFIPTMGS